MSKTRTLITRTSTVCRIAGSLVKSPLWVLMLRVAACWGLSLASATQAQVLPGEGNACLPSLGNGQICTAKDLRLSMELISAPEACQAGEMIEITGRVLITGSKNSTRAAAERYSVGFFLGENGAEAIDPQPSGSCTVSYLTPNSGTIDLASGSGPYKELSQTADACGDIDSNDRTYHDVTTTQVLCRDSDGDGRVDISAAVTWESNKNNNCSTPPVTSDFYPDQSSKCIFNPRLGIDIPVEQPPALHVSKTANPRVLRDPGGLVTYTVTVENASSQTDPITITSLQDDRFGDLNGRGSCRVPLVLPPGTDVSCRFQEQLSGVAGDSHVNTVTAAGVDDEGRTVTASDTATVTFIISNPGVTPPPVASVSLTKTGSKSSVPEPGEEVEYAITVSNSGDAELTITELTDDRIGGSLSGVGSCQLPQFLPVGSAYRCDYEQLVTGKPGDVVVNTATVVAQPTDTNIPSVTASDAFAVTIYDIPASLSVVKTPLQGEVTHPGAGSSVVVDYRVVLINESITDTIEITSLTDTQQEGVNGPTAPVNVLALGTPTGKPACSLPLTLPNTGSNSRYECFFSRPVNGDNVSDIDPGTTDVVADTVLAEGIDDDGASVSAAASAQVQVVAAPAGSIDVIKTAVPRVLDTVPGNVVYSVEVINTSESGSISLTALSDAVDGGASLDITDASQVITTTCQVPQVVAVGGSYICEFSLEVDGDPGKGVTDIVTAEGVDAGSNPLEATDDATVSIAASELDIDVVKTASPNITAPGERVTFTVSVTNNSTETVALAALTDSVYGDLSGRGDCVGTAPLLGGATLQCSFDEVPVTNVGPLHVNTVVATVTRRTKTARPGSTVSESDRAYVLVVAGGAAAAVPIGGVFALLISIGLLSLAKRALTPVKVPR